MKLLICERYKILKEKWYAITEIERKRGKVKSNGRIRERGIKNTRIENREKNEEVEIGQEIRIIEHNGECRGILQLATHAGVE